MHSENLWSFDGIGGFKVGTRAIAGIGGIVGETVAPAGEFSQVLPTFCTERQQFSVDVVIGESFP